MLEKSDPWRLMTLVEDAREGRIAATHPFNSWNAAQVEALWDNILNEWPVGPFVLLDVSGPRERLWRGRLGPYQVRPSAQRRLLVEEGAGKLAALAWSLAQKPTAMLSQCDVEELALWTRKTLVLDIDQRRVRFVEQDYTPARQLPLFLLPQAGPCLQTLNNLDLCPVEREWVNQSARRLIEARSPVYVFPDSSTRLAERLITNCRQIGAVDSHPGL